MIEGVEVWELRERRSWRLIGSYTSFDDAETEYQRRLRKATRRLNRPGLHGGISTAEFVDLVLVKAT